MVPARPVLQRQAGLGAVERLDLALLVDRQHHGVGSADRDTGRRRLRSLSTNGRIVGDLESFDAMRLQSVGAPDALDGTRADADRLGHHGGGPMGRLAGWSGLVEGYDAINDGRPQRRDTRRARLIAQQAVVTGLHETLLPAPHTGLRLAGPSHDFIGANTVRAQQDYLSPPDMLVQAVAVPRQRLQTAAVGRLKSDGNSGSHAPDLPCIQVPGNSLPAFYVRRDPLAASPRCQGRCLLAEDKVKSDTAEEQFKLALDVARKQGARSFEVRSATDLARLWHDQGKVQQARDLLAPVYGWFTEGFDTLDFREAKALLDELHD